MVGLLAAGAWLALAPLAMAKGKWQRLFFIERSKNANIVAYDVHLNDDGSLVEKDPLVAYWVLKAEDGRYAGLSWLERKLAYGFTILSRPTRDGFRFRMVALSDRVIDVRRVDGGYRAELTLAGHHCQLNRIYVRTHEGGIKPKVLYVDVYGTDLASGHEVVERIDS